METAAAAIANLIAYNIAAARAETTPGSLEKTCLVPPVNGFFPKLVRNWDVVGVCIVMGSLVVYAASQFRM